MPSCAQDPSQDAFLGDLVNAVDRNIVISGIGERPAIDHLTKFGLKAFTSGSVCVAPGLSMSLLRAIKRGDMAEAQRLRALFIPLEDQRDAHSPLRVLHDAVRLAGICDTGPMQPYLSNFTRSGDPCRHREGGEGIARRRTRAMAKAA